MVGSRLLGWTFNINDGSAHKKDSSINCRMAIARHIALSQRQSHSGNTYNIDSHYSLLLALASTLVMVSIVDNVRVACSLKKLVIEIVNEIIHPIREFTLRLHSGDCALLRMFTSDCLLIGQSWCWGVRLVAYHPIEIACWLSTCSSDFGFNNFCLEDDWRVKSPFCSHFGLRLGRH